MGVALPHEPQPNPLVLLDQFMEDCSNVVFGACDQQPADHSWEKLHDNLLDALLQEQARDAESLCSSTKSSRLLDSSSVSSRKRRLPPIPRTIAMRTKKIAPSGHQRQNSLASSAASSLLPVDDPTLCFDDLCRMQKDKGLGEPIGSAICCTGREACLDKLRHKLQLVTEVKAATMTRKPAKVAGYYPNHVIETRSWMDLRMGFVRMTYGILLRWNAERKVVLVVLRKLCHESFYPAVSRPAGPWLTSKAVETWKESATKPKGTLTVAVEHVEGLSKHSNWTVQLKYEEKTVYLLLVYDAKSKTMIPKLGDPLVHEDLDDNDWSNLHIQLWEHRPRRRHQRRLFCSLQVPLDASCARLQIPLPEGGSMVLNTQVTPVPTAPELPEPDEQESVWDWLLCGGWC